MALKRVDFRAEFKTKLEADHDWLYFDLTCYCGEEQITREKLLSYLQSGDPFYRREDGTMVTIANRETLEGLTRLLQNFQAQEDGGCGSLSHAPELEHIMASSPYYEAVRAKVFKPL